MRMPKGQVTTIKDSLPRDKQARQYEEILSLRRTLYPAQKLEPPSSLPNFAA
jgi:hypothetical protein